MMGMGKGKGLWAKVRAGGKSKGKGRGEGEDKDNPFSNQHRTMNPEALTVWTITMVSLSLMTTRWSEIVSTVVVVVVVG